MYEWINKMWCIHTKEYYLTIKGNGVLIYAMTCIHFENIVLSEKKPNTKGHVYDFIYMKFIWMSTISKSIETGNTLVVV